jgi:hypothetical protein
MALFQPRPSLEDSARFDHPVFTSLDFAAILFFFYRASSSALRSTPKLEDQASVFMSPSDRLACLYPQTPGSLFVAFYDSQGYGGGIPNHLHIDTAVLSCSLKYAATSSISVPVHLSQGLSIRCYVICAAEKRR